MSILKRDMRLAPVILLGGIVAAGYLTPIHPRGRLSAEQTVCRVEPSGYPLALARGTEVQEIQRQLIPPNHAQDVIEVMSGRWRGWRCIIETPGRLTKTE